VIDTIGLSQDSQIDDGQKRPGLHSEFEGVKMDKEIFEIRCFDTGI
jgi:hypothetical protein